MRIEARDTGDAVVSAKISLTLKRQLVELATSRDVSVAVVVQQALAAYVAANPVRRPGPRRAPPRRAP
jgi:predicted transcriptional regulator